MKKSEAIIIAPPIELRFKRRGTELDLYNSQNLLKIPSAKAKHCLIQAVEKLEFDLGSYINLKAYISDHTFSGDVERVLFEALGGRKRTRLETIFVDATIKPDTRRFSRRFMVKNSSSKFTTYLKEIRPLNVRQIFLEITDNASVSLIEEQAPFDERSNFYRLEEFQRPDGICLVRKSIARRDEFTETLDKHLPQLEFQQFRVRESSTSRIYTIFFYKKKVTTAIIRADFTGPTEAKEFQVPVWFGNEVSKQTKFQPENLASKS